MYEKNQEQKVYGSRYGGSDSDDCDVHACRI